MTDLLRWVYHETEKPKIVKEEEAEALYQDGWADTPARFIKLESVGVDKNKVDEGDADETAKAQSVLDSVQGITESLNGALNLDGMDKSELEEYAREHFSLELDRRKSLTNLVKQIREHIEAS